MKSFKYLIILILSLFPVIAIAQDSYHDTIVTCNILEDVSERYSYVYKNKLDIFVAFTGKDTIMLVSKRTDTLLSCMNYTFLNTGYKLKVLLKFIPNNHDFIKNILYERKWRDPKERSIVLLSRLVITSSKYNDFYYEQKYFRNDIGDYLFYYSPWIIGKYVPNSSIIEE